MCLGDWKAHGSEYYECSRYKENPNIAHESVHAQAREALKKYLHYYERVCWFPFFMYWLMLRWLLGLALMPFFRYEVVLRTCYLFVALKSLFLWEKGFLLFDGSSEVYILEISINIINFVLQYVI